MKVTKLEMQFLDDVSNSDHSSDGYGLVAWVEKYNFSMSMKQVRAVMTTLQAKSIIVVTLPAYGMPAWVEVNVEYQTESPEGWFVLHNLEVNA